MVKMILTKALMNMKNDPETPDFMRDLVSGCFTILNAIRTSVRLN